MCFSFRLIQPTHPAPAPRHPSGERRAPSPRTDNPRPTGNRQVHRQPALTGHMIRCSLTNIAQLHNQPACAQEACRSAASCMRTGNISATDYMLAHRLPAAALTLVSAQTPCRPHRVRAERAPHRPRAGSQAFIVSNKLEQSQAVSSNLDRPQPRQSTDVTYDSFEQARLGTYLASPIPNMLHTAHANTARVSGCPQPLGGSHHILSPMPFWRSHSKPAGKKAPLHSICLFTSRRRSIVAAAAKGRPHGFRIPSVLYPLQDPNSSYWCQQFTC